MCICTSQRYIRSPEKLSSIFMSGCSSQEWGYTIVNALNIKTNKQTNKKTHKQTEYTVKPTFNDKPSIHFIVDKGTKCSEAVG